MTAERNALLARARGYPYAAPAHSYTYDSGGTSPFDPAQTRGRTPVLAFGSNRAPEQLARKFVEDHHVVPVQRATLADHDVVYSAHVTSYGAIPAMLQACGDAHVAVAITWLDDHQLEVMHATEVNAANYHYAVVEDVVLSLDDGRVLDHAYAYVGLRGHLVHDGDAVALAAVECAGRVFPAMTTEELLRHLHARVDPHDDHDGFVTRLVEDMKYRRAATATLAEDSVPFAGRARRLPP